MGVAAGSDQQTMKKRQKKNSRKQHLPIVVASSFGIFMCMRVEKNQSLPMGSSAVKKHDLKTCFYLGRDLIFLLFSWLFFLSLS